MRAVTHWETCADGRGRVIQYIHGNEGTGVRLCSIADPASDAPARRIVNGAAGGIDADELAGSGRGLTVYGQHKFDRPTLGEAWLSIDKPAAVAIIEDCVRKGVGYSEPLVFEAVRKRLGMSQAELGLALDMAPGNSDMDARRRNVGRTIRRYETDGGPPKTVAQALRWMAWRAGILVEPHPSV